MLFEHASCCATLTYSRATADGADDAAGEVEEVHADYDALATAKMAYRNVPSVFNTWEGKHTRFPEDDEGDDDRCYTPVSEEMQAQVDAISASVSSAMLADPVL